MRMDGTKRSAGLLKKQPIMRRVLAVLMPCATGAIYFFGSRCLLIVVWAAVVGFTVEFVFARRREVFADQKARHR